VTAASKTPVVEVRLDEIVARFGGEIVGAGDTAISRIATLENAGAGELAFLANPKYRHQLATTRAAAVIMAPPAVEGVAAAILTAQPYLYYARVAQWLNPPPAPEPGIHPSAVVEGEVAASASIGPNVWIDRAPRSARVVIGSQLQHRGRSAIGADSRLAANVASIRAVASAPAAWCIPGR
jgi:UDP-3-O-[3-hydroxymyristoyl] glucosamine N-acyltransferase